jgi:hypothetical protein
MALDPNPAPGPSPLTVTQVFELAGDDLIKPVSVESKSTSRDFFTTRDTKPISRVTSQDSGHQQASTSYSRRGSHHSSQPGSPHIAYQAVNREPSSDGVEATRRRKDHILTSPPHPDVARERPRESPIDTRPPRPGDENEKDKFTLQEAPKSKKPSGPPRGSKPGGFSQTVDTSLPTVKSSSAPASASIQIKEQHVLLPSNESPISLRKNIPLNSSPVVKHEAKDRDSGRTDPLWTQSSQPSPTTHLDTLPQRSDSLARAGAKDKIARRDIGAGHVGHLLTTPSNKETERIKSASAASSISKLRGGRGRTTALGISILGKCP